jgi:hypothetical protein
MKYLFIAKVVVFPKNKKSFELTRTFIADTACRSLELDFYFSRLDNSDFSSNFAKN